MIVWLHCYCKIDSYVFRALPREYVKPLVGNSIDGHQPDKKASEATERSPLGINCRSYAKELAFKVVGMLI